MKETNWGRGYGNGEMARTGDVGDDGPMGHDAGLSGAGPKTHNNYSGTIAIVSNTSWSIYNFRLGLIRRLKELGYEVLVIAPKDTFSAKLVAEGFRYIDVDIANYGTNPLRDLRTLRHFTRIYREHNIDFIFHYTIKPNIYGSFAAARCKIPSIAITTGLGHLFSYKNPFVKWLSYYMYRTAARLSKQVWFLNEPDLDTFVSHKIVEKNKAFLLPSEGVDTGWFKPSPNRSRRDQPMTFLFAGRVLWDKGLAEFAEAARRIKAIHPSVEFQILGFIDPSNPNGVPFEKIEEWQEDGIVNYLGETSDVREHLETTDCLLFPSFYREGISRILLEAASSGIPIITTDNVGCREVVDDGVNGYLCKLRDAEDLSEKILKFIDLSDEDRELMGAAGRQKVLREFDEEIIIKHYLRTIDRFLPQNVSAQSIRTATREELSHVDK